MAIAKHVKEWAGRRLLGFDFFISYGRLDASQYAAALEQALKDRGFTCFLDRRDMPPGQSLSKTTRRALSASRVLLLVATDAAIASQYVHDEVRAYHTMARPIVAINVAGTFERTPAGTGVRGFLGDNIWISEPGADIPQAPSESATASLVRSFTFTKESAKRQRRLVSTVVVLLLLVVAALVAAYIATLARQQAQARMRLALSRQFAAEAQTYLPVQPDLAALLSLEAERMQDTVEARSALLAAVNERPRLLRTLPKMPPYPTCATMDHSGRLVAVGGAGGDIQLWRLPSAKPLGNSFGIQNDAVTKLRFDPTGSMVIAATDQTIRVWKITAAQPVSFALPHSPPHVLGMDLSPDGRLLVAGGRSANLWVWDMSSSPPFFRTISTMTSSDVWDVAFSPNGKILVVGTTDGAVRVYESGTFRFLYALAHGSHKGVSSLSFHANSDLLAAGFDDGSIFVWKRADANRSELVEAGRSHRRNQLQPTWRCYSCRRHRQCPDPLEHMVAYGDRPVAAHEFRLSECLVIHAGWRAVDCRPGRVSAVLIAFSES